MVGFEYWTRAELFANGWSRRHITAAVRAGRLLRPRRDHYLPSEAPADVVRAMRVGGRLTCLSLLSLLGIFVMSNTALHVHMESTGGRMATPDDRRKRLSTSSRRALRVHWLPLSVGAGQQTCVNVIDALAHAVLCQPLRAAIASIDSALHQGYLALADTNDLFALLPAKYGALRPLIDGRAESGPESLLRLMVRALGCRVELQVVFAGIGRVDMVLDGWLVVECDSREYHSDWESQVRDRRRDLALAARGYVTLRPTATMIMHDPESVLAAIRGLLAIRS